LFSVIWLLELVFIIISWDYGVSVIQDSDRPLYRASFQAVFYTRITLILLLALFLALLQTCDPVDKEEEVRVFRDFVFMDFLAAVLQIAALAAHTMAQKLVHSVLFDLYLERDNNGSQCRAILECFDTHAQRCESQTFTSRQRAFMKIVCLSSVLHGSKSSISSFRTRGLMQLMFLRLWPMSGLEQEVVAHVNGELSGLQLQTRFFVCLRILANTSIMELASWMGLILYAHTVISDGAVTSNWNGVYSEMLRGSKFTSWNVSHGQDPRYTKDLIYLMSDSLLACLGFCAIFPVPISASLILLLPVALVVQVCWLCCPAPIFVTRVSFLVSRLYFTIVTFRPMLMIPLRCCQVAFVTLPDIVQVHQLSPTGGISQSQLCLLVSFFVLQLHNLFLLRIHRNDYFFSARQRLNHLPQGGGNLLSNPARDRMIVLADEILSQISRVKDETQDVALAECAPPALSNASVSAVAETVSRPSSALFRAHTAISNLVRYLKDANTSRCEVCDLSHICKSVISSCQPLLDESSVVVKFLGRRSFLPLRLLLVDDNAFVRKCMQRLVRNRGYYYESCPDGESSVKMFEESLPYGANTFKRFDLIIMDKEMPTPEPGGQKAAGVAAVRRIRELSQQQAEREPGFKCPCIIGNSACTDEDDPALIEFRCELALARQQAGLSQKLLILPQKLSSWSDSFDREVRQLCGLNDALAAPKVDEVQEAPIVWGRPVRLHMIFYNLLMNAIHHGKPSDGEHCVSISYDVIDRRARMHPCLMQSYMGDEFERSLSWQLKTAFEDNTQRFVQVIVSDNGPGIDVQNERMRHSLGLARFMDSGVSSMPQAAAGSATSSHVCHFGIGLQHIVCPEVANHHGAMGVLSRNEPDTGCSFVVALPHMVGASLNSQTGFQRHCGDAKPKLCASCTCCIVSDSR
jgi:CheY-like chemotaxis protein